MAVGAVILGLFAYGGYQRQQRQMAVLADSGVPHAVTPATAAGAEIARAVPSGNLPTSPQMPGPAESGVLQPLEPFDQRAADPNSIRAASPVVVRQLPPPVTQQTTVHEQSPEERRLIAAYESEQQALMAPTTAQGRFGSSISTLGQGMTASANSQVPMAANGQTAPELIPAQLRPRTPSTLDDGDRDDQNMQATKEAFLSRARASQAEDYLKSTRTAPLSRFEIKAGWEIPAVLEQALNSDLPGELKALVSSNVYDTASGRYLLIPQGARVVGVYNSRIGYGQDGVQVIWDRIIYPDASSLDLSGMVGQDAHGFSGFRETVDHHYKRLVGFAVLTSLFAAASEISQNQSRSVLTYPTPAQVAGSAVGQQASELGAQVTRRNLNVQPTIKVSVGYRFNVRVNRDIVFDSPYQPHATLIRPTPATPRSSVQLALWPSSVSRFRAVVNSCSVNNVLHGVRSTKASTVRSSRPHC
jgi:type IV secretion system protein VirB10